MKVKKKKLNKSAQEKEKFWDEKLNCSLVFRLKFHFVPYIAWLAAIANKTTPHYYSRKFKLNQTRELIKLNPDCHVFFAIEENTE